MTSLDQPFAYTGREWDAATGLYHYRARAYDAETGRFLQEDPIGFAAGDLNIYRYVLSNPLSYTDPSGLVAATEGATLEKGTAGAGSAGMFNIGMRLNCIFTAIAAGIELSGTPDLEALDVIIAGTDTAMACGAKVKSKKKPKDKKDNDEICPLTCFAEGTLVHTRRGLKPIEQIQVGDEVRSMNPQTGEIAYKKVTNTHTNRFDPVGLVSLKDEADGSEMHLSVTATHPFHHSEKGWVHASLLKAGDKLTEDDGGTLTVTEVTFNPDAPINLTYNLEVADFHTYFVEQSGVLVHNGSSYVPVAIKRALLNSDRTPSYIKGWYQQQLNAGCPLSRTRNPPGHDWGHHPSVPASRGNGHGIRTRMEFARDNRSRGARFGR